MTSFLPAMRVKLLTLTLASLLLVPQLFAGESSSMVKFAVAPKYPTLPLEGRVYGEVTVRVTIDRGGSVKVATVTNGHPMLREAAVDAAQQWKFQTSSASKRMVVLRFSFVLLPENSAVISQTVFLPPTGIEIRQKPAEPLVQDQEGEFTLVEHPISTT
ncbi:MAG TPA: TonB family protein [Candidatus Acidoferrum sp.]|jgi:TonB family protein